MGVNACPQGTDPINDVEKLKRLIAQLETKIKENYKRSDEIGEWKASLAQVSCILRRQDKNLIPPQAYSRLFDGRRVRGCGGRGVGRTAWGGKLCCRSVARWIQLQHGSLSNPGEGPRRLLRRELLMMFGHDDRRLAQWMSTGKDGCWRSSSIGHQVFGFRV